MCWNLTRKKKQQEEVTTDDREFYLKIEDYYSGEYSELVVKSNNGADAIGKTLFHARAKKNPSPIMVEINSELRFPNFSLSLDEAKQLRDTLNLMIDYLEET